MQFQNIYSLFRAQTEKYRDRPVFYTRDSSGWQPQTWNDFEAKVHDAACAFLAKGLTKGAGVAILAGNIPEWSIVDIAAIAAGGVGVGIYPTSSPEQCEYIINHSDAEFVVVDTAAQLSKLSGLELPKVKEILVIESQDTLPNDRVSAFGEFLKLGRGRRDELMPRVEEIGRSAE